jgi:hypothetical protein
LHDQILTSLRDPLFKAPFWTEVPSLTVTFSPTLRWEEFHAVIERSLAEVLKGVEPAEASTSLDENSLSESAREELLASAALLLEESDFNNELAFADEFRNFILKYRALGVRVFERFCLREGASIAVIAEGLRELGRMTDPNTHEARMQFLRKCLTHPSPIVRDAAGLGLSLLGDKRAIPFLARAIKAENRQLCRMALESSLVELRS